MQYILHNTDFGNTLTEKQAKFEFNALIAIVRTPN